MSASSGIKTVGDDRDYAVVRFSTDDYAPRQRVEALHEIFARDLQKVHVVLR